MLLFLIANEESDDGRLTIDYQNIDYQNNTQNVSVGVFYAGTCPFFRVEYCPEEEIIEEEIMDEVCTELLFNARSSTVSILRTRYARITAVDGDENICSNSLSHATFYRINAGMQCRIPS